MRSGEALETTFHRMKVRDFLPSLYCGPVCNAISKYLEDVYIPLVERTEAYFAERPH